MPPKVDKKGTQRNVECSNNYGIWSSVWIPEGKVEVFESKGFLCGYCNFSKIQLDITAITKDLQQNSNLGSRLKTLEEKDHTMSEANSAILLSNVETEKKKKECNVITRGLKKMPKHEAEEKMIFFHFSK